MDNLADELQKVYDSEINISIDWLWDAGITLCLGDEFNSYKAEEGVSSIAEVLPWLQEAIAHFYPESTYARSLASAVAERASKRVFHSRSHASAVCPHCGARSTMPGVETVLAFVCRNCGRSVQVKQPAVQ